MRVIREILSTDRWSPWKTLVGMLLFVSVGVNVCASSALGQTVGERYDMCLELQALLGNELVGCAHPLGMEHLENRQRESGAPAQNAAWAPSRPVHATYQAGQAQMATKRLQELLQNPDLDHNLYFRIGTSQLEVESVDKLSKLALLLRSPVMGATCLKMVGHTDASGAADVNKRISLARAEIARDALLGQLAPFQVPIDVDGRGETELLPGVPNGAAKNRRVEIWARPCS